MFWSIKLTYWNDLHDFWYFFPRALKFLHFPSRTFSLETQPRLSWRELWEQWSNHRTPLKRKAYAPCQKSFPGLHTLLLELAHIQQIPSAGSNPCPVLLLQFLDPMGRPVPSPLFQQQWQVLSTAGDGISSSATAAESKVQQFGLFCQLKVSLLSVIPFGNSDLYNLFSGAPPKTKFCKPHMLL